MTPEERLKAIENIRTLWKGYPWPGIMEELNWLIGRIKILESEAAGLRAAIQKLKEKL